MRLDIEWEDKLIILKLCVRACAQTDGPLFEAVSLLCHHSTSTCARAGCPLGPLAPPVGGHFQFLLQTVGCHTIFLSTHTRTRPLILWFR